MSLYFLFSGMVWRLPIYYEPLTDRIWWSRRGVSAQELCRSSRNFSLEQIEIGISGPCTHQSNSLDVNTAKNGGTWKKAKDKVTLYGVPSSCNAQKWKVTALRSCNLSSEIHEDRHLSSCHALPADRRNKTLECRLKGCLVLHQCYLVLLACKKIKLTPFKKLCSRTRGLLTGTSWNWHIWPLHAWK